MKKIKVTFEEGIEFTDCPADKFTLEELYIAHSYGCDIEIIETAE